MKPKKEFVIFNGADPKYYQRTESDGVKRVIMSARWKQRGHKRLKEMLEIAVEYRKAHEDVQFYVAGDNEYMKKKWDGIAMLGHIEEPELKALINKCDCMLNIAYYDWCPNAVVESLVAGVPVICASGSGVSEIVRYSGITLELNDPLPLDIKRCCNPPPFDRYPVLSALDEVLFSGWEFPKPEHLYIETIAKQYAEAFNEILR